MTELKYIEVNGNQYTNLGIACNSTGLTVEMGYLPDSFSVNTGIWAGAWAMNGYVMTTYIGYFRWHSKGSAINVNTGLLTDDFNIIKTTKDVLTVNGTDYPISGSQTNVSDALQLFNGMNNFYNASGKMSYCKVWVNDTLVRDLVPAKDDNDRVGLYDTVNDTYYYSTSGTDFIAGPTVYYPTTQESALMAELTASQISSKLVMSNMTITEVVADTLDPSTINCIGLYSDVVRGGVQSNFDVQVGALFLNDETSNLTWPAVAGQASKKNITTATEDFSQLFRNAYTGSYKWLCRRNSNLTFYPSYGFAYFGSYIDVETYSKWLIYTANDGSDRDPTKYGLIVGNFDSTTGVLTFRIIDYDEHTGTTSRNSLAYTGDIDLTPPAPPTPPTDKYARYIKMAITKRRGGGSGYIQLSEIKLVDNNNTSFQWPSGTEVTATTSATGSSESPQKLIDGSTSTKFCTGTSGSTTITIDTKSVAIDLNTYHKWQWYTANDSSDRDPVSFELSYSVDGTEWIVLDTQTDATITTSRQALAYTGDYEEKLEAAYIVQFNSNNPAAETETQRIKCGVATALRANTFSYIPNVFLGWATSASGTVVYTDEEIVTDLAAADATIDLYAVWELGASFLLGDGSGKIYTLVNDTPTQLQGVSESSLTKAIFQANGFTDTITQAVLQQLTDPIIYRWDLDRANEVSAQVIATPYPQSIVSQINLNKPYVTGILSVDASYSGNVDIAYSYDNSTWTTMTLANFLEIDLGTLYNGLSSSKILYIKIILKDANAEFNSFNMIYQREFS